MQILFFSFVIPIPFIRYSIFLCLQQYMSSSRVNQAAQIYSARIKMYNKGGREYGMSEWDDDVRALASLNYILHYCSGNMSRGILRGRVHGSIMERGLQIEIHGLLRTAAIHTETDLYHRWVVRGVLVSLLMASRVCGPKRDIAEINPIFALSTAQNWIVRIVPALYSYIARRTVCAANFARLGPGPNIESISLKSRLRAALCVSRPSFCRTRSFHEWNTRDRSAVKFLS